MPNSVVQYYRQQFPQDTRTDDEVTLYFGTLYKPEELAKYPDFVEDYKRLTAPPVTLGDRARQFVGSAVRGGANVIADAFDSTAQAAAALERKFGGLVQDDPDDLGKVEPKLTHKIADKIRKTAADYTPLPVAGLEDSFWETKLPSGLGSTLAFMAGGVAGKAAKIPAYIAPALMGAATSASGGYNDAIAHGADEDTAFKSYLANAGVGLSEAAPVSMILNRLDKISGGTFKKALIHAGKESFAEALQEAFQSAAGDHIAKNIVAYDKDREMFKDLKENAAVGGLSGAIVSLAASAITHKLGGKVHAAPDVHASANKGETVNTPAPADTSIDVARTNYANPRDLTDEQKADILQLIRLEAAGQGDVAAPLKARVLADATAAAYYQVEKAQQPAAPAEPEEKAPEVAATPPAEPAVAPPVASTPKEKTEEEAPKSSTQLTLAPADAAPIREFAASIPDAEVYHKADETGAEDYGVEKEPHVTVLYGLTDHDPAAAQEIVAGAGPLTVTLGKMSIFEGNDYDVLKVDVEGPELRKLNAALAKLPNENSFPDYKPHLTLAYLKKGEGKKYVGDTRFEGQKYTFNSVTFSPPKALRQTVGRPELSLAVPAAEAADPVVAPVVDDAEVTLDAGPRYRTGMVDGWFRVVDTTTNNPVGEKHQSLDDATQAAADLNAGKTPAVISAPPTVSPPRESTPASEKKPKAKGLAKLNPTPEAAAAYREQQIKAKADYYAKQQADAEKAVAKLAKEIEAEHEAALAKKKPYTIPAEKAAKLDQMMARAEYFKRAAGEVSARAGAPSTAKFDVGDIDTATSAVEQFGGEMEQADEDEDGDQPGTVKRAHYPAYFDTQSGNDAGAALAELAAKGYSPRLGAMLTSDSRALGHTSQTVTHRLAAFVNKAGEVLLLSVYKRSRKAGAVKYYVANTTSSKTGGNLDTFMAAGWTPIASIRTAVPVQDFIRHYATLAEFQQDTAGAAEMMESSRRTADAVSQQIAAGGFRRPEQSHDEPTNVSMQEEPEPVAGEAQVDESVTNSEASQPIEGQPIMSPHDAGVLFEGIRNLTAHYGGNVSRAIFAAVDSEYLDGVKQAVGAMMIKSGEITAKNTVDDAYLAIEEKLASLIGAAYGNNKENFIQTMAGESGAKVVPAEPANGGVSDQAANPAASTASTAAATPVSGELRNRPRQEVPHLTSERRIDRVFRDALETLTANGITVELTEDAMRDGQGQYQGNQIKLAVADAVNPSGESLVGLLHEAGHVVFAAESAARQDALQNAIASGTDEALGIAGANFAIDPNAANPAGVAQEERLTESIARALEREGFNPAEARGIIQRITRMVVDIYTRAVMAIQKAVYGKASPQTAARYFKNRMEAFLARDRSPMSFTTFMGGYRPELRYRKLTFVNDPMEISGDVDSTNLAARDIAAHNEISSILETVFNDWTAKGLNTGGLTFEQFLLTGVVEIDGIPRTQIDDINMRLAREGFTQVDETTAIADLPKSFGDRASAMALATLRRIQTALTKRRGETEWEVRDTRNRSSLPNQLVRSNARLVDLQTNYTNAEHIFEAVRDIIADDLPEFRRDMKEYGSLAHKKGILTQVIEALEGKISKPLASQYESLLNRFYATYVTGGHGAKLVDILDRVTGLSIPWGSLTAVDVRRLLQAAAPGDPLLEQLVKDKAMLAMVIAFGKRNETVLDFLELRRSKAIDERIIVNNAMKLAMSDAKDAIQNARKMVAKLPRLAVVADRILQKLNEQKRLNRELLQRIKAGEEFIAFHEEAKGIIATQMAGLERRVGVVNEEWEAHHGARYFVPPAATSTEDEVLAASRVLELGAGSKSFRALLSDTRKMADWLRNQPADNRGAFWETVKRQMEKLGELNDDSAITLIKNGGLGGIMFRVMGSITDRLDLVGSPLARNLAQRMRRFDFLNQSNYGHDADIAGTKWAALEAASMRVMGVKDIGVFRDLFFDRAMKFIESRQDILAAHSDTAVARAEVLKELRRYLDSDPDTRDFLTHKGAWDALEKYYTQAAANNGQLDSVRKDMGLKVQDALFLRETIGDALFTMQRGLSNSVEGVYQKLREMWEPGVDPEAGAEKVAAGYAADPAATAAALKLSPDLWNRFVRPIVFRPGKSAFYGAERPDGTMPMALRQTVIQAFQAAPAGDVVAFAENLHKLTGAGGDAAAFVGETVSTFQAFYNALHGIHQDAAQPNQYGMAVPAKTLMNARVSEEFPAEWLSYKPLDAGSMRQQVRLLALHSAFGRNMEAVRADFEASISEQRALTEQFRDVARTVQAAMAGRGSRAIKAAMKVEAERLGGPGYLTVLESAQKNHANLTDLNDKFTAFIKNAAGLPMELRSYNELLRTVVAFAVQGPATALSDTLSMIEQPFRKLGLSAATVGMIAQTGKSFAGEVFGTLGQAFHRTVGYNAEYVARRYRLGYYDSDAVMTLKEKLHGELHKDLYLVDEGGPLAGVETAVSKAARGARALMSTGIGTATGDKAFATLKPWAAFTQVGHWMHSATIDGTWRTYEDMVARAVEYFENPANIADFNDPDFKFKHTDLGYGRRYFGISNDEHAFAYLTEALNRLGMSVEQLAHGAIERRMADPHAPLMEDEHYRRLAALARNEITLESSIVTRPIGMLTNPVLAAAAPLLGWSITKSVDVVKGFREADGRASWKGFRVQLLAYAAILPAALAYAFMRDEWDENIQGKKANVMAGDNFRGMLDRLGRVGTFGIYGDFANSMLNKDTNREFSVDQRVFFLSTARGVSDGIGTWIRQGDATWATVGRPLMQSLGGSGALQYADILNNTLSLDNMESRAVARINVNNYLRTVGRDLNLDVRAGSGSGSQPTPVKPQVGEMVLSAYANDPIAFSEAYRAAVAAAKEDGRSQAEAEDYIKRSFGSYHPLRAVFKTAPSEADYARIVNSLNDRGREAVSSSVRLFNAYAAQLGIKPYEGKAQGKPITLAEARRLATIR